MHDQPWHPSANNVQTDRENFRESDAYNFTYYNLNTPTQAEKKQKQKQ